MINSFEESDEKQPCTKEQTKEFAAALRELKAMRAH